jgi:voltage-gated potassium channel
MGGKSLYLIIRQMRLPIFVLIVTFAISILGLVLIPGVDDQGHPYHLTFFDAFYFVSYMASTIGFGESPYAFNYPQKLWVAFCIYLTVTGWFYAIGAIVELVQDKVLAEQLALAQFMKRVKKLDEPFFIFVGYNRLNRAVIKKLSRQNIHSVVIEKSEEKLHLLKLEDFAIAVPGLLADAKDPQSFRLAGIHKPNCRGIVSLFNDDVLNLRVALTAKLMNRRLRVIAEATKTSYAQNLETVGVSDVINPFAIVARRVYSAIREPSLLVLEQWLYGEPLVLRKKDRLPRKGRYIVCGYGRLGRAIEKGLKRTGIDYLFIEADCKKAGRAREPECVLVGAADDKRMLLEANIQEASCIIAATADDLLNLSIIMAAKRLNPHIYTIARENNMDDLVIFKGAKIDRIIELDRLRVNRTYSMIAYPLAVRFMALMAYRGEAWAAKVIETMKRKVGPNPSRLETVIDEAHAFALHRALEAGRKITLQALYRRRDDRCRFNPIVALYLRRGEEEMVMPPEDTPLKVGDEIFFAGTPEAFDDAETIMENIYELRYVASA